MKFQDCAARNYSVSFNFCMATEITLSGTFENKCLFCSQMERACLSYNSDLLCQESSVLTTVLFSHRKKSLTVDSKSTQRLKKRGGSPLVTRKSTEPQQAGTGSSSASGGSTSRLRATPHTDAAVAGTSAASDGGHSDSEAVSKNSFGQHVCSRG